MQRKRSVIAGGLAAAAAAALIAAPAQAATPNSCVQTPSKSVIVKLVAGGGGVIQLEREGDKLVFFDVFGKGECHNSVTGEAATVYNSTEVFMRGTSAADDFIVSFRGGRFEPGAPGLPIGPDPSQVEITVGNDVQDTVDIVGSDGSDFLGIAGGTATGHIGGVYAGLFKALPAVKLPTDPKLLRVNGLGGSDNIWGRHVQVPTSMHLQLIGGAGNDDLTDGLLPTDLLQGDEGNDTFNTKDGQPGDNITGGSGVDTATIDPTDQTFQVEQYIH